MWEREPWLLWEYTDRPRTVREVPEVVIAYECLVLLKFPIALTHAEGGEAEQGPPGEVPDGGEVQEGTDQLDESCRTIQSL